MNRHKAFRPKRLMSIFLLFEDMKLYLKYWSLLICLILITEWLPAQNSTENAPSIILGAEQLDTYLPLLKNAKIGFCGNQTSLINNTHLVDILIKHHVNLVKIFCPEHGFRGHTEAGASINNEIDPITKLPIISLYGKNKKPTPEQLKDIDIILFDIQDIGVRFYTYTSTLHYIMEAAAEQDKKVIVLDRPNPNGSYTDGPVLDTAFRSFVGMHPVPIVHGLTIGEYALMINDEKYLAKGLHCDLTVIAMKNYTHHTHYELPVSPSPNLQNMQAIYLYPSLCFFEGTVISIGRGTDKPFMIFGHSQNPIGNYYFTPHPIKGVSENPPENGLKCLGFDLSHIKPPQQINLTYLILMYQEFPDKYHFFLKNLFFDKLAGNNILREQITNNVSEEDIRKSWQADLDKYRKIRQKYLLYLD